MTRFPERHKVPEFSIFASLLRMSIKYSLSDVRDQLIEDLKGAYPTRWKIFRSAKVLGEDIFGSPKPHPNAVLNLFEAQNVMFAIPFAAYRASIGGFQALMSDTPGTTLSRGRLATTVEGMDSLSAWVSDFARAVAYERFHSVCPDKECTMNVGINPVKKRLEALEKVYSAMIEKREGGLLSPPSLKHFCMGCAKDVKVAHDIWISIFWERLPSVFNLFCGWDEL